MDKSCLGPWPARLLVLVAGMLTSLLLLEGGLRLLSFSYAVSIRAPMDALEEGRYRVLCVGDSFTKGLGAPAGRGYPEQLEELLVAGDRQDFQVINAGRFGTNSTAMLDRLPGQLVDVDPQLVILLVGANNNWDLYGFRGKEGSDAGIGPIRDLLFATSSYRFIRLTEHNLRKFSFEAAYSEAVEALGAAGSAGPPSSDPAPEACIEAADRRLTGDLEAASALLLDAPHHATCHRVRAEIELDLADAGRAMDPLLRAVREDPHDVSTLLAVARYFQLEGDRGLAMAWLDRALVGPEPPDLTVVLDVVERLLVLGKTSRAFELMVNLSGVRPVDRQQRLRLARAHLACGNRAAARELLPGAMDARGWEAATVRELSAAGETPYEAWLAADLREAVAMIRDSGGRVVLQTYPAHAMSSPARTVARELDLPLVDHEPVFSALPNPASHLVPDGHCNEAGYHLMAQTLAPVVRSLASSTPDDPR